MPHHLQGDSRAVVIGAGISGLLTAHVLAGYYNRVTVIERDDLPLTPHQRKGVPQGTHVHALFARGLEALEDLLPGFQAALADSGAHRIDMGRDLALATPYGWGSRRFANLPAVGASRPLIEHVIRQHVMTSPHITLLTGHRATSLCGGPNHLDAVEVSTSSTEGSRQLPSDLVADAAGRTSQVGKWLTELGCPVPKTVTVDAHVGYATRIFRSARPPTHWRACYSLPLGPHTPRGGVLAPIEDDRWIVTLTGPGENRPTTATDDFLPFARTLSTPLIADFIADAEPLTPVRGSHATANHRRVGHPAARPDNLLITGDSACALNPVYAQGMTVAALSSLALRACLTRSDGRPGTLARHFHQAQRSIQRRPWLLATAADNRHPTTTGARPTPLHAVAGHGLDRLLLAGTHSPEAQHRFLAVMAMTASPATIIRPRTLRFLMARTRPTALHGTLPPLPAE
ncbi:NAD(P)/FAD-dependent oxidoreductase [Streptomyces cyaneofuscatus]|uniref:NAD(P)/FAD-dependent oxidoreductase n=1 Tax=Streptomyces cyaneofuscatus TaxID=66883 RepID=UPI00339EB8A4